jgi:ABC-2 type transport system permease protein
MLTNLRYSLSRSLWGILGWGLSLAVLGGYLVTFYDTLAPQQAALTEMLKAYPRELIAFFGDMANMFQPAGYLNVEFFSYMPIILGIFAIMAGSGLLAGDEENGNLDLVMAYPVSRSALFWARQAAFVLSIIAILLITWVGFVLLIPSTSLDISPLEMLYPFLSLLAAMLLFGGFAQLLSMLLPSRRLAAMISGLLMVASFFITSLERINPDLESIANFSPLNYYQGGMAIDRMNWEWFAGLIAVALLFILLSWWRFERRDIRVGGEGSWSIPGLSFGKGRKVVLNTSPTGKIVGG